MVEHDMELASREKTLKDAGHAMPEFMGHDQEVARLAEAPSLMEDWQGESRQGLPVR